MKWLKKVTEIRASVVQARLQDTAIFIVVVRYVGILEADDTACKGLTSTACMSHCDLQVQAVATTSWFDDVLNRQLGSCAGRGTCQNALPFD